MVRVFLARRVDRIARKARIADLDFVEAVRYAESGGPIADLGAGLFKLRMAREGEGKSGGYRTLLAYRRGDVAFVIDVFAKSDFENLDAERLAALKGLSVRILSADREEIEFLIDSGAFRELSPLE